MAPARRRLVPFVATAAAAVLLLATNARAQISECPISAAEAGQQDYKAVKAACAGERAFFLVVWGAGGKL
jgi:hypothetical protein